MSLLLLLAVLFVVLAVAGGIFVHPLLFLIVILAVFAFVGAGRGTRL